MELLPEINAFSFLSEDCFRLRYLVRLAIWLWNFSFRTSKFFFIFHSTFTREPWQRNRRVRKIEGIEGSWNWCRGGWMLNRLWTWLALWTRQESNSPMRYHSPFVMKSDKSPPSSELRTRSSYQGQSSIKTSVSYSIPFKILRSVRMLLWLLSTAYLVHCTQTGKARPCEGNGYR